MSDQQQLLKDNHRRNAILHWIDAGAFHFGFAFIQPSFIVVAYLKHFTDSGVLLNFPVFLSNFALGIGPLLASMIRLRKTSRKRALIVASVIQRVMLIPMIVTTSVTRWSPGTAAAMFLASFAAYSFAWGFSYFYWQELVSRTVDPDRRTSVLGVRDAVAKAVDIVASLVTIYVVRALPFPTNYTACFLITLVSLVVSMAFVFPMREVAIDSERERSTTRYFASILTLPRENPDFAWFMVFVILSSGTLFVGGLYTSVTLDRFGATHGGDSLAGVLKVVAGVSGIIAAMIIGKLSDRHGRFWGFLPCSLAGVAAPLTAMVAHEVFALQILVFILRGVAMSKWFLEVSATLSFAGPEHQHRYIAFVGIAKLLPVFLYTNAGGLIAQLSSPEATFAVSAAFALTATAVLVLQVKPRWERKGARR